MTDNPNFQLVDLKIDLNINNLKVEFNKEKLDLIKKTNINAHILDYAINDACVMFKSKITNLKNGHIVKYRLRRLRKSKINKILKIEKLLWSKNTFCSSVIGQSILTAPKIDNYKDKIDTVAIIQYNKRKNMYYLLLREKVTKQINEFIGFINNLCFIIFNIVFDIIFSMSTGCFDDINFIVFL